MRKNKIGVLISLNLDSALTHDLFSRILDSFKSYCEQNGYIIVFINVSPKYLVRHSIVDQVKSEELDGIFIATGNYEQPEIRELFEEDIPIVTVDYQHNRVISVASDNESGIKGLVDYVVNDQNHRRIAYISGDSESPVSQTRLKAFISTCERLGVEIKRDYICESRFRDIRLVARRTEELINLQVPPTCIFFPDDFSAIGGINVIRNRGLDVPKDISFCGYDGVNLVSYLDPQICTVVQDTETMGITSAKEMIKMIESESVGDGRVLTIPTKLQYGHTVARLQKV